MLFLYCQAVLFSIFFSRAADAEIAHAALCAADLPCSIAHVSFSEWTSVVSNELYRTQISQSVPIHWPSEYPASGKLQALTWYGIFCILVFRAPLTTASRSFFFQEITVTSDTVAIMT